MTVIIDVLCTKCGKKQKMELRQPKFTEFGNPIIKNKRRTCTRCEKSFTLTKDNVFIPKD